MYMTFLFLSRHLYSSENSHFPLFTQQGSNNKPTAKTLLKPPSTYVLSDTQITANLEFLIKH